MSAKNDARVIEIVGMLDDLRHVWLKHPEWRLGQLIVNVSGRDDSFYMPDAKMAVLLERARHEEVAS